MNRKNLGVIIAHTVGIVCSLIGVIVSFIDKDLVCGLWAFSSFAWAVSSLINVMSNENFCE